MKHNLVKRKDRFTQISNIILNDNRISYTAKGIFAYLYSKPNDWQVLIEKNVCRNKNDPEDTQKEGEYAVRKALSELKKYNYVCWERYYIKGKVAGINYFFEDEGRALELMKESKNLNLDFQDEENLNLENQDEHIYITNKDITKKDIDKKAIASAGLSFQKKEEVVSEEVKKPNKDDFKDMWRKIIGDVNLDQQIPSYNKCVDCWEKMKEKNKKTKYKNDLNQYFEKWIYAEREEMKKKGNIPLKSSTGQKEAQNEPIVYEEPKPVEIHIKNEFKEVCVKIERAVDNCFSINHFISRAIAFIDGEELIIYNKPTWMPVERYEERARALIKEILNKYNITVLDTKFVYKNAIRVIND